MLWVCASYILSKFNFAEGYIESARDADVLTEGGKPPPQRKRKTTSNLENFTGITDRIKIHGK